MGRGSGNLPGNPDGAFGYRRTPRGISSMELLIAMIILTVGILGVLTAFSPSYTAVSTAGRQDHALALAYDKLEELRNYPWDSIASGFDSPAGGFTRSWTITKSSNLATVQIRITHPGIPNTVNLVSYIVTQ